MVQLWLAAGGSAVPCSSRGRVSAGIRVRASVRARASAIARLRWWRWVVCGGMGGGFGCYVGGV